jgi:hypothetical protein
MAGWLILLVAVIYFVVGCLNFYNKQIGLGIVFISYAVSNIGLYLMR